MNSSYFPPKTRSLIGWNGWVSQSEAWFLAGNSWISFLKLRYKVTSTYHKMKKGKGNFEFSSTQKFEMWKNFEGICCKNFSSSMNPKIVKSVSLDFTKSLERVYILTIPIWLNWRHHIHGILQFRFVQIGPAICTKKSIVNMFVEK